ncbi:MAG: hypothetical protein K0Q49_2356 [Haloplasmataceae bacterium]|nr:hypothetical protein [Haloplasmataceae bacterium]
MFKYVLLGLLGGFCFLILSLIMLFYITDVFNLSLSLKTIETLQSIRAKLPDIIIIYVFVSALIVLMYDQLTGGKNQKESDNLLELFLSDIKNKADNDLLISYKEKDESRINKLTLYQDKRFISELIKYNHIETLKYLIKNDFDISNYETEIEKLISKSYVTKNRDVEDFADFFADRI